MRYESKVGDQRGIDIKTCCKKEKSGQESGQLRPTTKRKEETKDPQIKMHVFLLLGCFVLTTTEYFLCSAHMSPDEILSNNKVVVSNVSNALSQSLQIHSPPVVIVELPKTARKSRKGKKQKKKKYGAKHPPPPPPPPPTAPANCSPLWGSCKSPSNVCCDSCAFCQCRLFRTVCFCRMGNPHC
ncbi:agouti-signaling protein-like [Solea solea]|uniref:agouti-signaling protein-like n=1 Tax=Solea solea TaxID=90069 RepID=UPI00272C615A|nr:agouti-signaling protein-like [Solea solea]XP_058488499.1 agouti-signaling protein-like [Solea solea]